MRNPLVIQCPVPEAVARAALISLGVYGSPKKARTIPLGPENHIVRVDLIQPGESSPTQDFQLSCDVDLPSLVSSGGFTTNVVRRFIPPLLEHGKRRLAVHLDDEQQLTEVGPKDVIVKRIPFSFLFELESPSSTLDAFYRRFFKHLKVTLDCAEQYPGGRKRSNPPLPKVNPVISQRHAFEFELLHYPHRLPFGKATLSVAWDGFDLPAKIGDESREERIALRDRLRRILRIDISLETQRPLPISPETTLHAPEDYQSLGQLANTFMEDVYRGFQWAAWFNEAFCADLGEAASAELKPTYRELLNAHLEGTNLKTHYLIRDDPGELLKFRRLLLRDARVDVLVPWEAAMQGEAKWLNSAFQYSHRLDPGEDDQLAPYCLSSINADSTIRKLLGS